MLTGAGNVDNPAEPDNHNQQLLESCDRLTIALYLILPKIVFCYYIAPSELARMTLRMARP